MPNCGANRSNCSRLLVPMGRAQSSNEDRRNRAWEIEDRGMIDDARIRWGAGRVYAYTHARRNDRIGQRGWWRLAWNCIIRLGTSRISMSCIFHEARTRRRGGNHIAFGSLNAVPSLSLLPLSRTCSSSCSRYVRVPSFPSLSRV